MGGGGSRWNEEGTGALSGDYVNCVKHACRRDTQPVPCETTSYTIEGHIFYTQDAAYNFKRSHNGINACNKTVVYSLFC